MCWTGAAVGEAVGVGEAVVVGVGEAVAVAELVPVGTAETVALDAGLGLVVGVALGDTTDVGRPLGEDVGLGGVPPAPPPQAASAMIATQQSPILIRTFLPHLKSADRATRSAFRHEACGACLKMML